MTYNEVCGDNRFELIEKYKEKLLDGTNIETAKDEMAVIDSILFRFWQMYWLDKLEQFDALKADIERLQGELITEKTRRENAVKAYHEAKAEAIKEVVEAWEEKIRYEPMRGSFDYELGYTDAWERSKEIVYNLVKEMVGDPNDG